MACRIALDVMGGDHGVPMNIQGALRLVGRLDHEIILVGDRLLIEQELKNHPTVKPFQIVDAPQVVGMHEEPARACRAKKDSSIMTCARLVSEGQADAFVSAGNSGAAMTASLWHLRRLRGVSRPAIAVTLPTLEGHCIVLDVGANVDCKPKHLAQFAIMGSIYARALWNLSQPRVGLLTIGEEEGKGNELTQATHELLKLSGLNYVGHVEGRDIPRGKADVVVCDGFVGNVILKFGEGLAAALLTLIRQELRKHPLAIFGKFLMGGAFKNIKRKTDPAEYGGAPLLGVNGVVMICHGGSDPRAIDNALAAAGLFVERNINRDILEQLHAHTERFEPVRVSA